MTVALDRGDAVRAAGRPRGAASPFAYWMGGWRPEHGVAIGISFVDRPAGRRHGRLRGRAWCWPR